MEVNSQRSGPHALYTAAQVRELDRLAIEQQGIPGYTLMSRAGEACWQCLQARWPAARSLQVLCGTGNNGGDGFVVARLAHAANWQVQVLQLGDVGQLQGDALTAYNDYVEAGGQLLPFTGSTVLEADVLVDAMLGSGIDRPLTGNWQLAVEQLNASSSPLLSVDIPSGLQADTGAVSGVAAHADVTLTVIGRKVGLYTGAGPDYAGDTVFSDLDVPAVVYRQVTAAARLLYRAPPGLLCTPRARTAHKGQHGRVLVVGGCEGMGGAVRLAGEAALRSGAGLVSVATHPAHAAFITAACPELMCHGVADARALKVLVAAADVLVLGPGLGRSVWAQALLGVVLESAQPRVIDADALNLLAGAPANTDAQVLTPHPGEAARLLGQDIATVQQDRVAAVRAIAQQYGGVAVLKGAGTVIHAEAESPLICAAGNPGMATAGMGDVLSGIIGAFIAQGLAVHTAAVAAVCVHACAGDAAAGQGERGLLARDVIAALRGVIQAQGESA